MFYNPENEDVALVPSIYTYILKEQIINFEG